MRKRLTVNGLRFTARGSHFTNRKLKTVNRKGMELSVNFLVIIIISLVLFGMSLYFINKFRDVGASYEANLDNYAIEQLRSLSRDKSFGIYPAEVQMSVGGSEVIGVGVTNNGPTGKFYLHIDFSSAYDEKGNDLYTASELTLRKTEINKWISAIQTIGTDMASGQFQSFIIGVNPKPFTNKELKSGLYEFNVCITTRKLNPNEDCAGVSSSQSNPLYPSGVIKGFTVRIE